MRVAIHRNEKVFRHSTTWDHVWMLRCKQWGIDYEVVDCFRRDALEQLRDFDALLWHFSHYSATEMRFARMFLTAAHEMGLAVFPNYATSWHFDDKIAQSHLLKAIGAPIPDYLVVYREQLAGQLELPSDWSFPVVAKLARGSGSSNVRLIRSPTELRAYARIMMRHGYKATPDVALKVSSNVRSSRDLKMLVGRARRIPDFLASLKASRVLPRESGYMYLQKFIPNEGFDVRVVVIGDRLGFWARPVRSGDFRASGGGAAIYDRSYLTPEMSRSAFEIVDRLGAQCLGFDFIVDSTTGKALIGEMSYGFPHQTLLGNPGHMLRDGTWIDEPLDGPTAALIDLLRESSDR